MLTWLLSIQRRDDWLTGSPVETATFVFDAQRKRALCFESNVAKDGEIIVTGRITQFNPAWIRYRCYF